MPTGPEIHEIIRSFCNERIPFNGFLGMRVTELGDGTATLEVPFRPELVGDPLRPALHGGVLSALIDAAGGTAAFTQISVPHDRLSTIDLRVDYLRPAELETVVAQASVTRMGNRVASVDVRCFHPQSPERLIATGKAVYNVRRQGD